MCKSNYNELQSYADSDNDSMPSLISNSSISDGSDSESESESDYSPFLSSYERCMNRQTTMINKIFISDIMEKLISEVIVRNSNNNDFICNDGLVEPPRQRLPRLVIISIDGFRSYRENLPIGHSHSYTDDKKIH